MVYLGWQELMGRRYRFSTSESQSDLMSVMCIYRILCVQGPKGDMGERGHPGERGEKGEMGLSGPSVSPGH